jgi:predicted transcriptional regulator
LPKWEKKGLANNVLGAAKLNSHQLQFTLLKHQRDWNGAKGARRAKLDIIAEILLYCEQKKTKTSIMYNTNLNYKQLKNHIDNLTAQGLVIKQTNKYLTTEKGYHFLELFVQINDLLDKVTL